jgi:chromate transport protein ChrA
MHFSDPVLLALIATISPTIAAAAAVIIALRTGKAVDQVKTDLEAEKSKVAKVVTLATVRAGRRKTDRNPEQ